MKLLRLIELALDSSAEFDPGELAELERIYGHATSIIKPVPRITISDSNQTCIFSNQTCVLHDPKLVEARG